jgi:hypothetical protein
MFRSMAGAGVVVMVGIILAGLLVTVGGITDQTAVAAGVDQTVTGQTITGVLKVETGDEFYIIRDETGTERVLRRSSDPQASEAGLKIGDKIETVENTDGRVSSIKRMQTDAGALKERLSGRK